MTPIGDILLLPSSTPPSPPSSDRYQPILLSSSRSHRRTVVLAGCMAGCGARVVRCGALTWVVAVCWCCVGSDRVAGVSVSLGTLDLVRVNGRLCLGCEVTLPFPVNDYQIDRSNFQHRLGPARFERQCAGGPRGSFQGPASGHRQSKCHPRGSQSHKLHGHDPPCCHQLRRRTAHCVRA